MKKDNNLTVRITSLFLSAVTVVTMGGCVIKKEQSKENVTITPMTSVSMSNEVSEKDIKSTEEVVIKEEAEPTYEELVTLLQENSEHLDENIQKDLMNLLKIMYSNKDAVDQVLPLFGFDKSANLIKDKFIAPLKELEFIDVHYATEDDYYDKICKYSTSCYVPEEKGIHIFCDESNESSQAHILAEEVIHSGQNYKKTKEDLLVSYYLVFGEGEANLFSWSLVYGSISNLPATFFYDDNEELLTNVGYGLGYSAHSLCTKYYMYLNTLLGNEVLENYKKSFDDKILIDNLNKKGVDGKTLLEDMRKVALAYSCGTEKEKEVVEAFVNLEKTFLSCLEKEVVNIDTKEETEDFLEMYRYLNIQYGYEFIEYSPDFDITYKTGTKLDKTNLENILFEKCQKFGVLTGFSENKDTERAVFNALINPPKQRDENVYPIGILNSKITYDASTNTVFVENSDDCSYSQNIQTGNVKREKDQGNSINDVGMKITISSKSR